MSRRSKIIIVLAILLLLLFGWWLLSRRQVVPEVINDPGAVVYPTGGLPPTGTTPGGSIGLNAAPQPTNTNSAAATPPKPDVGSSLKRVAAAFAERYGSFSNQSDYENVLDLKYYMTDSLQAWADAYVADERQKPRSPLYYGVTTRAISVEISAMDEQAGTAVLLVKTQRRQSGNFEGDAVYYQDLKLDFVKAGEQWKVNAVEWLPR